MSEPEKIETQYRFGEIVWAKVKGHPWWPGMVLSFFIHPNLILNSIFFKFRSKKFTKNHPLTVLKSYMNTKLLSLAKNLSNFKFFNLPIYDFIFFSSSKLSTEKLAKFDSNFKKFACIKKSKLAASI